MGHKGAGHVGMGCGAQATCPPTPSWSRGSSLNRRVGTLSGSKTTQNLMSVQVRLCHQMNLSQPLGKRLAVFLELSDSGFVGKGCGLTVRAKLSMRHGRHSA